MKIFIRNEKNMQKVQIGRGIYFCAIRKFCFSIFLHAELFLLNFVFQEPGRRNLAEKIQDAKKLPKKIESQENKFHIKFTFFW